MSDQLLKHVLSELQDIKSNMLTKDNLDEFKRDVDIQFANVKADLAEVKLI